MPLLYKHAQQHSDDENVLSARHTSCISVPPELKETESIHRNAEKKEDVWNVPGVSSAMLLDLLE